MNTGAGVIIGRFQVADLTLGHSNLIHRVAKKHNKVVILLEVHPKLSTRENPLDYEARAHMLREHWDQTVAVNTGSKKLLIAPVLNNATNSSWSVSVDRLLDTLVGPHIPKTLYGGGGSSINQYTGSIPVGDIRTPKELEDDVEFREPGSSAEQRAVLFEQSPLTEEGRAGAIWAVGNQWSRIDPCVDMAVFRGAPDKLTVLMGKKYSGTGLYCFPGGHIDSVKDSSAEAAASRELLEETKLEVNPGDWTYVCHQPVKDWRRLPSQGVWSTLYETFITEPEAEQCCAGSDLDDVFWVSLSVPITSIAQPHRRMFLKLCEFNGVLRPNEDYDLI